MGRQALWRSLFQTLQHKMQAPHSLVLTFTRPLGHRHTKALLELHTPSTPLLVHEPFLWSKCWPFSAILPHPSQLLLQSEYTLLHSA